MKSLNTLVIIALISPIFMGAQTDILIPYSFGKQNPSQNRWGYADTSRNIVIPPVFKDVHGFTRNHFIVETEQGIGIVNQYRENLTEWDKSHWMVADDYYIKVYENKGGRAYYYENDLPTAIYSIASGDYIETEAYNLFKGVYVGGQEFFITVSEDKWYGLVVLDGDQGFKVVIEPNYNSIRYHEEKQMFHLRKDSDWFEFDPLAAESKPVSKDKVHIREESLVADDFLLHDDSHSGNNRKMIVQADSTGHYGLIDARGQVILPFEYDAIYYNRYRRAYTIKKEDKYGLFYPRGSAPYYVPDFVPPTYSEPLSGLTFFNGYTVGYVDDGAGRVLYYLDKKGFAYKLD